MSSARRNTNSALSDLLIEPKATGHVQESRFEQDAVQFGPNAGTGRDTLGDTVIILIYLYTISCLRVTK